MLHSLVMRGYRQRWSAPRITASTLQKWRWILWRWHTAAHVAGLKSSPACKSYRSVECICPCTTAYTEWPPEWSARERYNLLCISQKAHAHKCSSFHLFEVWSASRFVTSTIREVQIGKSMIVTVWKRSQPNVWDSLAWDDGDRV